jgi:hypothetical protein
MTREEVKREVQSYIKVLETNYNDKISTLKLELAKAKKITKNEQSKRVEKNSEKSELEQLFVSCVEDTRREVMKRRLKAEVMTR